ncbi:uncharacterized protein LOC127008448 [Eriocheir sinensis]|uniref:uncharacterized protein LOC127008448 n=1 Tax=Eriocheir sinensis TaxID=95602 RepID=UPI0021C7070E|nr:uncharacterized protein LOC127008448 [Eriocheir sinensis]
MVVVTVVVVGSATVYHHHNQQQLLTPEKCREATEEECLSLMVSGSPLWNDPRLIQVVREDFLTPPSAPSPPPPSTSTPSMTPEEYRVVKLLKDTIGDVKFMVVAGGAYPGVVGELGSGARGLWVEPRPEGTPTPHTPVHPPHFWHTHACPAISIPYLNKRKEQCIPVTSLLRGLGHEGTVDLVLTPIHMLSQVLTPLLYSKPPTVKAAVTGRSKDTLSLLGIHDNDVRQHVLVGNNTTLLLFNV